MAVSQAQYDVRRCPVCGTEVSTLLWLIIHRHERPKLWTQASELHAVRCRNNHAGRIRAPLVLFDPECPFIIYVPQPQAATDAEPSDASFLLDQLWQSLPPDERSRRRTVETIPFEALPALLEHPLVNLGDLAPGAERSEAALEICRTIRAGGVGPEQLIAWGEDGDLPEALRFGVLFELASLLASHYSHDLAAIERAVTVWRQVIGFYKERVSRRWAVACGELAHCYTLRRSATVSANRREALRLMETALSVLTSADYPEEFALLQSRRANLLLDTYGPAAVDDALKSFGAALTVYTRESYPEDWALVLTNMATAHLEAGGDEKSEHLHHAIAALEGALTVRDPRVHAEDWLVTQMNLGIALSRLPSSELNSPRLRAIEELRRAYRLACEHDIERLRYAAGYNLGIVLAREKNISLAWEAIERLEECLPWLFETGQTQQASDGVASIAIAYIMLLEAQEGCESGKDRELCTRALAVLQAHLDNEDALRAYHRIALWLLTHSDGHPERLGKAQTALERILGATRSQHQTAARASTLANLATVLMLQEQTLGSEVRARAGQCMNEAVRLLRSLPPTPERERQIGLILSNQVRSGLGSVRPES